jgi:hypothetical protein
MAGSKTLIASNDNSTTYTVVLPTDADTVSFDLGNATILMLDSRNTITADKVRIDMYSTSDGASATKSEYVKPTGELPFEATNDMLVGIDVRGLSRVVLTRVGAVDASITFTVGLSNNLIIV